MFVRILIGLVVIVTLAWTQELPQVKLAEVNVEGNQRASAQVIQSTARLFPGLSVTALDIQRGIRRLWELGFFGNIQIYLDEETPEGAILRIVVEEYPSLEKLVIEGNKKIGKSKIEEEIGLKPPQILSEYALAEAVRKIKQLYYKDGFLNVEITTETEPGEREFGRILTVHIKENRKVRIGDVRFEGNEEISTLMLRMQMKDTKRWRWYFFWRSPFDRDKYEADLDKVLTYYQNRGYRDAHILSDSIVVGQEGKSIELVIHLEEGPHYYYRQFTWEGNTLHTDEELEFALGFKKGDLYNKGAFQEAVSQRVHPIYLDEGYLYSAVEPVEYPVGEDSVDVVFGITEGDKVAVRYINVTGNDKTRDYVVRRELRIHPGETFSYEKLTRSQRDVWILNYFENVQPDVLPVDEDEVDLSFKVTEKSTGKANLSVGYTAQYGVIGGGGVEMPNLGGTGQQLNVSYNRGTQYSLDPRYGTPGSYQSFSVSLMNPWLLNTPNTVGFSAYYSERGQSQMLYLPFDIQQYGGSARLGRRFRWPDSFFRGLWLYQGSNKLYIGQPAELSRYLPDIADEVNLSQVIDSVRTVGISLTQSIVRDSRNRPEFPTMGSEFEWRSTLSGVFLGGNEDFHKHEFTVKWYVPTAVPKLVFYHMTKLGVVKQVRGQSGRSILPPDEKFYIGGSGIYYGEMLRGYPDNSIGPHYNNRPLGGTVMMKYSAELRLSLSENPTVYALIFMDMGNTWADFSHVDPFNLKRSAGFGVRMFMPMLGMLGLDMGYGFDPIEDEGAPHGWEFHFLFGMPF